MEVDYQMGELIQITITLLIFILLVIFIVNLKSLNKIHVEIVNYTKIFLKLIVYASEG